MIVSPDRTRPSVRRPERTRVPLAVLLLLSAIGWVCTVRWAREMGNGPGTMGLALVPFLGVWVVMMAAMMLPTLSAVTISGHARLAGAPATAIFAAGYLTVWALAGTLFYAAGFGTKPLAEHHHDLAVGAAVAIFLVCAGYQLSPWKRRLLRGCARPVAPAAPPADTYREGVRCGTRCVGASWGAMSLLLALGFMQVVAMLVLAAALVVERRAGSRAVSAVLGAGALLYGVAVATHPGLAPGLAAPAMPMR